MLGIVEIAKLESHTKENAGKQTHKWPESFDCDWSFTSSKVFVSTCGHLVKHTHGVQGQ